MEKWIETTGEVWNCAVINSHYGMQLSVFNNELLPEAKKSFPNLQPEDIECFKVVNSTRCKGVAMIRFQIPAGSKIPDGWLTNNYVEELRQ